MNDKVIEAIAQGAIPESFTKEEESYTKACILFNDQDYENCLKETFTLSDLGLVDISLVVSVFCIYIQEDFEYHIIDRASIIISKHAKNIDPHLCGCLREQLHEYHVNKGEHLKCIERNLRNFINIDNKKINLDIDYKKLENSTIVNCYYNESCCGIGDYLRGCCSLFELFNENNVNFEMSFAKSYISKYVTTRYDKNFSEKEIFDTEKYNKENCCAHDYFNNMTTNINNTLKEQKDIYYIFSNYIDEDIACEIKPLSDDCKQFMKSNIIFSDEIETIFSKFFKETYEVAHFRLGDRHSLSNFETIQDDFNTEHFDIDYNKLLQKIVDLHESTENKIVLLSDSNDFKQYVEKQKYDYVEVFHINSKHSSNNPGFIKSMTVDHDKKTSDMLYCALDMKILSKAKAIHSYSVYPWGSGFCTWIANIFDVPAIRNSV